MTKTEKFIQEFKFDSNIVLDGNPGVGKTYIMQQLYKRLPKISTEDGLTKYWIDDGAFRENIIARNMELMPTESKGKDVLLHIFELCLRVKVLFFDDLGASGNVSEAQKTKLKYILDERERKGFITIFSTNLSPTGVLDLYGGRIKSRLYNGKSKNGLMLINVPGEDRRKENIKTMTL